MCSTHHRFCLKNVVQRFVGAERSPDRTSRPKNVVGGVRAGTQARIGDYFIQNPTEYQYFSYVIRVKTCKTCEWMLYCERSLSIEVSVEL